MACSAGQIETLSTPAKFSLWYSEYNTSLNSYAAQPGTPSQSQKDAVSTIMADITSMNLCIQSKVNANGNLPNTIYASQDEISRLEAQIAQEEANAAIARDRVSYIRHPERNVSNYESWFPIDRPIQTFSLLIIMSLTVFLGTFLLLLLLSFMGVNIVFLTEYTDSANSSWIYEQFTSLTGLSLIALLAVIIYFTTKKSS
jgi:hypothetical protein